MWSMPEGDGILTDAEWEVFRALLKELRRIAQDSIESGVNTWESGIKAFDGLPGGLRLVLMAECGVALCDPETPAPLLTAANLGIIAAAHKRFQWHLSQEIAQAKARPKETVGADNLINTTYRAALLEILSTSLVPLDNLPDISCDDLAEWQRLADWWYNRWVGDADFEAAEKLWDVPRQQEEENLARAGLDPDYYFFSKEPPTDMEIEKARNTLDWLAIFGLHSVHLAKNPLANLHPSLRDMFHDLVIGPCTEEQLAGWEDNPWVCSILTLKPEWHCDYSTWIEHFSQALPAKTLEFEPLQEDTSSRLPKGTTVVRYEDGWAVRTTSGDYWTGLIENCWTNDTNLETPLTFFSKAGAKAMYLKASRFYHDREIRHQAALTLLGVPDIQ